MFWYCKAVYYNLKYCMSIFPSSAHFTPCGAAISLKNIFIIAECIGPTTAILLTKVVSERNEGHN